jgi:hypothetical protein
MSAEQIELVKAHAPAFEAFVEAHTNNKVDIQITIDVLQNPVTRLWGSAEAVNVSEMPEADEARLSPENNYDSCIMSVDFTGIPRANRWHGKNYGFYSIVAYTQTHGGSMSYNNQFDKRNVYVHEWCHQLEDYFPSLDRAFAMPDLHSRPGYTVKNTGLPGKYVEPKWYADYLAGTIVQYSGATNTRKGVNADWWQYHPLTVKSQAAGDFEFIGLSGINGIFITRYTGSATLVEIPAQINGRPVVYIWPGAFNNRWRLTSVTIPNSVTVIGMLAFRGCSGLTSVTISSSVRYIHAEAFLGCSGLTSVTIPFPGKPRSGRTLLRTPRRSLSIRTSIV